MADRDQGFGGSAARRSAAKPKPSPKTRTIVSAKSGNECAFPECREEVVKKRESGEEYLAGDLCHIYGKAEGSARYDPARPVEEINAPENLLFLCPNHHREVDADPGRYPVSVLREMKAAHEQLTSAVTHEHLTDLLTLAVEKDLRHLRQARFFQGFDSTTYALAFRKKLQEEYAGAKPPARARAFAWCARVLAGDRLEAAEDCLRLSVGSIPGGEASIEIEIARAVVHAERDGVSQALEDFAPESSPLALSAALALSNRHGDAEAALAWFDGMGGTHSALDSDGRLVLLMILQFTDRWERVGAVISDLTPLDYEKAPALHYVVGVALVAAQTPDDLRAQVLAEVPLNVVHFPLASTPEAREKLNEARRRFEKAEASARWLGATSVATTAGDYSLWLRLLDPEHRENAITDLTRALAVLPENLRLAPMAIQCGVTFDTERIEEVIGEQSALGSKFATDAAFARLAVAFTKEPAEAARYLEKYADTLSPHIERAQITARRVELLLSAHDHDGARRIVEDLASAEFPEEELERLRSLLEFSTSTDAAALKVQFDRTNATGDLWRLVVEMQRKADWKGVCDYGRRLFNRTHSLESAERLAAALINAEKREDLDKFLERSDISAMTKVSETLKTIRCWHLFDTGRVRECGALLNELPDDRRDPNRENLRFNLAVVTGDWLTIPALVAKSYENREEKDVEDLVDIAQRSLVLDLPYTKDLVHAVAVRGHDDPHAMAAAYWLAVEAEMEDDATVGRWLHRAVAMSDDRGPMRKIDLSEVIAQAQAWRERVTRVSALARSGKIPACAVSRVLGIPLLDITLRCAIENMAMDSNGGRGVVAAYSGSRGDASIDSTARVGIGPSAVMTLVLLGALEDAIGQMETVVIPHGLLAWLFVEKAAMRFPQPSRLAEARVVAHLRVEGILETTEEVDSVEPIGKASVGRDLASLLVAAGAADDGKRHLVVTEYPVRVLAGEKLVPVDLRRYHGSIVSPGSVMRALEGRLGLDDEAKREVMRFISGETGEWPDEPPLVAGTVLYFDALTLGKFVEARMHLGQLMRHVVNAGYRVRVSEETMRDYSDILHQEEVHRGMLAYIEETRRVLNGGIISGKIRLAARSLRRAERGAADDHPELDLVRLAEGGADPLTGIIVDDRYLNQYREIGAQSRVPVWTTWDWIRRDRALGNCGSRELAQKMATLRRAGFLFVPLTGEDLAAAVMPAEVEKEELTPTRDLTAIQAEISLIRDSRCLQIPEDLPWLRTFVGGCAEAIRRAWRESGREDEAQTRADWIQSLVGGVGRTIRPEGVTIPEVAVVLAEYAAALERPLLTLQPSRARRYREWVERGVSGSLEPGLTRARDRGTKIAVER